MVYTEQQCAGKGCTNTVFVPDWFKPFSDLCETCRPKAIEDFAGLDKEPDIIEGDNDES